MKQTDISEWFKEHDIEEIEVIVPDMAGVARGKMLPAEKFIEQSTMRLPESVFTQTVTGEFLNEPVINPADRDILVRPDLNTLRRLPWTKDPAATVINDCYYEDGSAVDISPRQVLKNVLSAYEALNMVPIVAPELEFYLVKRNTDPSLPLEPPIGRSGRQETVRQPFSIDALDEFEPIIEDIHNYSEAMDIKIDTLEHEMGTAQLEINFEHGDPLHICDQVFMFKRIVREAAMQHNVYATFMSKPMQHEPGNAMHWHISVLEEQSKNNIFSATDGEEAELLVNLNSRVYDLQNVRMNILTYPTEYRIHIIPQEERKIFVDKYTEHIKWIGDNFGDGVAKRGFESVLDFLQQENYENLIPDFIDRNTPSRTSMILPEVRIGAQVSRTRATVLFRSSTMNVKKTFPLLDKTSSPDRLAPGLATGLTSLILSP